MLSEKIILVKGSDKKVSSRLIIALKNSLPEDSKMDSIYLKSGHAWVNYHYKGSSYLASFTVGLVKLTMVSNTKVK